MKNRSEKVENEYYRVEKREKDIVDQIMDSEKTVRYIDILDALEM